MQAVAVLVVSFVAAACQSKGTSTSGSGSGSGSGTAPTKERTTLDIKLPALSGKPPIKTTAPLDKAQLATLAKLSFPEFALEVTEYPIVVAIRQRATLRPKMSVNITIGPCIENFRCTPMTLDAWRAEAPTLKAAVDEGLVDRPDSTFEVGETTIGGSPAFYVYQAGQFFGNDARGNPIGSYSHAYTLHYNDGVNFVRVAVSFSDNPRDSLDDMKRALPRDFLARVATAFLDAYGQAWAIPTR